MAGRLRLKNAYYFEWIVSPSSEEPILGEFVSEDFLFQGCGFHFGCMLEQFDIFSRKYVCLLYIGKNKGRHLPVNVIVHATIGSEIVSFAAKTVTITDAWQEIWRHKQPEKNLGGLDVKFEIIIHASIECETAEKSTQTSSYEDPCFSVQILSQDFSKLLDEGPNHDAEFLCGDESIKAHKNILCSRSSVFASMLQSDMVEGKTGRVTIRDIDATIFKQFLKTLYTGMLSKLTVDSALQLYEISDKYDVNAVKKQCADFLTDNLSSENACEVLMLFDQHSDIDFRGKVIEFVIKENIPYVDEKWTDFCKANPVLATEVLNLFCHKFRPK